MAVFYRTYRPQKLSDLIGQETIVNTLFSQLESGKIGHGYLFFGPKGTGKTSTARIFAKAVNCQLYGSQFTVHSKKGTVNREPSTFNKYGEPCNKCTNCLAVVDGSHLDLIEIDAASNRGIDEIRDLKEKIKFSPASSRFKVYIIDEAHMLTTEAFNALLKTLEEPPAHAIFILCTTEYGKLPQTIVSRLQKFNFSRARRDDLEKVVEKIARSEDIKIQKEATIEIAQIADGSYRDAVSILDQLSAKKKTIRIEDVLKIARVGGWNQLYEFVNYLAFGNLKDAVSHIENLANAGADISYFAKQVVLFLEKLLFIKIGIETNLIEEYNKDQIEKMRSLAGEFDDNSLQKIMKQFLVAESEIKFYPLGQIPLVLAVCKVTSQKAEGNAYFVESNSTSRSKQSSYEPKIATLPHHSIGAVQTGDTGVKTAAKVPFRLPRRKAGSEASEPRPEGRRDTESKTVKPVVVRSLIAEAAGKVGQAKKPKGSIKVIKKNWDKFLKKVRLINAHVEALLRSTRPIEFDGANLTLEVFYRFHKQKLEEPKIIKMLDSVMEEVVKERVKMRFTLASDDTRPPRIVAKSDVVEIGNQDLEKMAQEIFSK